MGPCWEYLAFSKAVQAAIVAAESILLCHQTTVKQAYSDCQTARDRQLSWFLELMFSGKMPAVCMYILHQATGATRQCTIKSLVQHPPLPVW